MYCHTVFTVSHIRKLLAKENCCSSPKNPITDHMLMISQLLKSLVKAAKVQLTCFTLQLESVRNMPTVILWLSSQADTCQSEVT